MEWVWISGLPKVDFWAVAEAVAVDGKTSATVAVAEAVAEGQVMMGIDLHGNLAYTPNLALFLMFKVNFLIFFVRENSALSLKFLPSVYHAFTNK